MKNGKGQKVEITFEGNAHIRAHKESHGMVFFNASFFFESTDQNYEEPINPKKDE